MTEFVRVTRNAATALVHPDYGVVVADALLDGKDCRPSQATGRSAIEEFPYDGGIGLIRPYRRGGVVGLIVKDTYAFVNRPLRELKVHRFAYENGLSTPLPLGVCWTRSGPFFRGKFATQAVDAVDLNRFLGGGRSNAEEKLRECGALIRSMHELGIIHADLQVKNILVGDQKCYLIDFDNARRRPATGGVASARNLLRLRRSIQKSGYPADCFQLICEGYGVQSLPGWLARVYAAKGAVSDLLSGRSNAR